MMPDSQTVIAWRLCIAALIGLAAGLEREWSGHTVGPDARFAGLRTFFLLGLSGGAAGLLSAVALPPVGAAIVVGAAALCVAGYASATRRSGSATDGTTEAAGITVVALGALAGLGWLAVAAGAGALVVFVLREKDRLHAVVRHLDEAELRAGLAFAVLAVVVLPLLPAGPYLGALNLRPRSLWAVVLLFSGLNFGGFVARRALGAERGFGFAGALGGVVSSTLVTLSFSRKSRVDAASGAGLALGVTAACTVLIPRVLAVAGVLNPGVALALMPLLAPAFLVGAALSVVGWRSGSLGHARAAPVETNPLRLGAAVRMALAFQAAIVAVALVRRVWGTSGILGTAAVLGLTDVDALTVAMSRPQVPIAAVVASHAIAIGILCNTLLKLGIALVLGRASFRRRAAASLSALALATGAGLLLA